MPNISSLLTVYILVYPPLRTGILKNVLLFLNMISASSIFYLCSRIKSSSSSFYSSNSSSNLYFLELLISMIFLMGFEIMFDLNVLFFSASSMKIGFCLFFTSDVLLPVFLFFCLTILCFLAFPSIIYRSLTKFYSFMPFSSFFRCCDFYDDSFNNPSFSIVFLLRDPTFLPLFFIIRKTSSFFLPFIAFRFFFLMIFLFLSTFYLFFLSDCSFNKELKYGPLKIYLNKKFLI